MTIAMYAEAQAEGSVGMWMVGNVILNRAVNNKKSICQVVHAKGQFTFDKHVANTALAKGKIPKATQDMAAKAVLLLFMGVVLDITNGSVYYKRHDVHPSWAKVMKKTFRYKNHEFYKEREHGR